MIDIPAEVKNALREGNRPKNYRFIVLNDNGTENFTIDNNNIVAESVKIDERLCSGDTLKYGLCEGSSLEFEYFDKPNITGRRIQAFVDAEYEHTEQGEPTYWGTIDELNIPYTFIEAHTYRLDITERNDILLFVEVLDDQGNTIDECEVQPQESRTMTVTVPVGGQIVIERPLDPDERLYVTIDMYVVPEPVKSIQWYAIPMGFFNVEKCARQASTGIRKATCYNKLKSTYLDAKANELIDAAIAQREDGSSEVSIYTILNRLLADYSIEEYTETSQDVLVLGGWAYNVDTVKADGASGYYAGYTVTCSVPLSTLDYYKFTTSLALLKAKIRGLIPTTYVSVGGERMLLLDYAKSSYLGASFFGGSLDFIKPEDSAYALTILSQPDNIDSRYYTNHSSLNIRIPVIVEYTSSSNPTVTDAKMAQMKRIIEQWLEEINLIITVTKKELSPIEKYRIGAGVITSDVTLRELQSAVYETLCKFGQLSRATDLFSGVELGQTVSESFVNSQIATLWADEDNVKKWRYLIITYKGLDENQQEKDFTLQRTVNADGTDDYNMSDNWLFRNLVWTAADIGSYAAAMVAKMQNTTWFPFEMWAAGLPYLETGDEVQMTVGSEDYTSYILQRQLNGIQNLQDTYINGTLDIY